jgi:ribosomal protein L24E
VKDWDECKGCRKAFRDGEGLGYMRGNRMVWVCDDECLKRHARRQRRRLRDKRSKLLVTG